MLRTDILADAGRLVAPHAMVWIRRLDAPVDDVWRLISTLDGLAKWWIVPPTVLELRPGGTFKHHWDNTVYDYREGEFIDFREPNGSYVGTGGMRLEVRRDGNGTVFAFLGTWAEGVKALAKATWPDNPVGRAHRGQASRAAGTTWSTRWRRWQRAKTSGTTTRNCGTSTSTTSPISIDGATPYNVGPDAA